MNPTVAAPLLGLALVAPLALALAPRSASEDPVVDLVSVTPNQGATGLAITLAGSGFVSKPVVWLTQDGLTKKFPCKVTSFTAEQVVATLPQAPPGSFDLHVKVKKATDDLSDALTIQPPSVSALAPESAAHKQLVTITGDFLGTKKGKVRVQSAATAAPLKKTAKVTSWTNTSVTFEMPKVPEGSYDVLLDNKTGAVAAGTIAALASGGGSPGGPGLHCTIDGSALHATGPQFFPLYLSTLQLVTVTGNDPGNPTRTITLSFLLDLGDDSVPKTFTNGSSAANLYYQETGGGPTKSWSGVPSGTFTIHLTKKNGAEIGGDFSGTLKDVGGQLPDKTVGGGTYLGTLVVQ